MPDDGKRGATSPGIHAVIDRIEDNDMAVVLLGDDEREKIDLPLALLPEGASDGDHLRISITLDPESRAAAEAEIGRLRDRLEKRSGTKGQKNFKL
ncbi:MAG TPA: DUF3006 domain-containing protein [Pyrinomonadaceae bacterium]|jgi:hypothetical protein|nr:DUF3006 domain-containing protein [Pyrinomonadaceae bacterium]